MPFYVSMVYISLYTKFSVFLRNLKGNDVTWKHSIKKLHLHYKITSYEYTLSEGKTWDFCTRLELFTLAMCTEMSMRNGLKAPIRWLSATHMDFQQCNWSPLFLFLHTNDVVTNCSVANMFFYCTALKRTFLQWCMASTDAPGIMFVGFCRKKCLLAITKSRTHKNGRLE